WRQQVQRILLKQLNWNFLVIGNSTLTGEQGVYFSSAISPQAQLDLLFSAGEQIQRDYQLSVDVTVSKDWYVDSAYDCQTSVRSGFHKCVIQPNMILPIQPNWYNFEQYLSDMRSKYRVRIKRAFKKRKGIEQRCLGLEEIKQQEATIYRLYGNIATAADLNVAELPAHYFYSLKEQLGEKFQVLGYFDRGQLIGFCTTLQDHHILEAHFLGLEESYNSSHQLYLNMLLDMVQLGIAQGSSEITFSRTAMEIKSSIGAVPHDMFGYIKHHNPLVHHFVPALFRFFESEMKWIQRRPFKDNAMENSQMN
ncbi:MAG: GNAT family N-acetyltransferase, partial [Bacteroidota bacterium]